MKVLSSKSTQVITATVSILLLSCAVYLVCPVVKDKASALSATISTLTTAQVDNTITLSVPSTAYIDLTPSTDDTDVYRSTTITARVATNHTYGYGLYIGADQTALVNTSRATYIIPTTTLPTGYNPLNPPTGPNASPNTAGKTGIPLSTLSPNTWAYTTDNNGLDGNGTGYGELTRDTYLPMSSTNNPTLIRFNDYTTRGEDTNITFSIHTGDNIASGTYKNTITLSAIANLEPYRLKDGLYMQDPDIATMCTNTPTWDENDEETQKTYGLIDQRDDKVYAVRKLKDGNCWMTENLNLGSSTEDLTLTNSDTDLRTKQDGTSLTSFVLPKSSSIKWTSDGTDLTAYVQLGSSSIDNWTQGMGGYYSWGTATAGTGKLENNNTAPSSICPKGWQLPIAPDAHTTGEKSYYNLLAVVYSIASDAAGISRFQLEPLSFSASGHRYYEGAIVYNITIDGRYWSATGAGAEYARRLALNNGPSPYVALQSNSNPASGASIRCLAR